MVSLVNELETRGVFTPRQDGDTWHEQVTMLLLHSMKFYRPGFLNQLLSTLRGYQKRSIVQQLLVILEDVSSDNLVVTREDGLEVLLPFLNLSNGSTD